MTDTVGAKDKCSRGVQLRVFPKLLVFFLPVGFGFSGQKLSRFLFMGQSQGVPKTAEN
jgi:hypothetical protein